MASRVAKNPVEIPKGVDVNLSGQKLSIKGKQGELQRVIHSAVKVEQVENALQFSPANATGESNALAGTMRALVNNMVIGVSQGFKRKLVLMGVGYRAKVQGKVLNLTLGFSHPVDFNLPEGVSAETPSTTEIVLSSANKQELGQAAANIRAIRPPEPYKGKGVRYENERIVLKEIKKK